MDFKTFEKTLKKVMNHNHYEYNMKTTDECNKYNKWTPTDLIIREYLNNGAMSAKGFLGISSASCIQAYEYIVENRDNLIEQHLVNEEGYNNFGMQLWSNYDF